MANYAVLFILCITIIMGLYAEGVVAPMKVQKGTQSNFKRFLKENRTIVYTFPILIVLIIAVIIVYSNLGGKKPDNTSTPAMAESSAGNNIEILPQTQRAVETGAGAGSDAAKGVQAAKDPFSGPVTLKGVLTRADGNNMAIIEGDGKSYIVKKDDVIEGNLLVESISENEVLVKQNNQEISLRLPQIENSQTVSK